VTSTASVIGGTVPEPHDHGEREEDQEHRDGERGIGVGLQLLEDGER
jgi:hypothetical protein